MAKGGARPGAGHPKGKKTAKTLEREGVLAAFRQRTMKIADLLLNSQLTLARGQTYLYRIDKEKRGSGNKVYYVNSKPVLVTAQHEIEMYLEGETESGDPHDDHDPSASYYFLTTKDPHNPAIDSLLDRSFGKSAQSVDFTTKGEKLPTPIFDPRAYVQTNDSNKKDSKLNEKN